MAIGDPELWQHDVTTAAGVSFDRVPRDSFENYVDRISGGVCVIDVDHRPPMDLFFALRPSTSGGSRLYVSDGPLHYAEEAEARGLSDVGDAMGCLAFDADGDGDDDLLVTGRGSIRLFLADSGSFSDATASLGLSLRATDTYTSAAAADFDGDGDLDLAIAGDFFFDPSAAPSCARCVVDGASYDAIGNLLLYRQSDGTYLDVGASLAPAFVFPEATLTLQAVDLDDDGDVDILEGNDFGFFYPNRALIQRRSGTFVDRGRRLGLDRNHRGFAMDAMGMATGDINRDGFLDHVVSSFELDATAVFECDATGHCSDEALTVGTLATAETFRWGSALVDLDQDGWLDLVEATGHVFTDPELIGFGGETYFDQFPNLMASNGDGTLRATAPTPDDGRAVRRSLRGIAITDLDEDGQPDVVFAPAIGSPLLLRTVRPRVGHYLRITLRGRAPNTGAIGAKVTVRAGSSVYVRPRLAGEGYLGNFDPRLFFGVAEDGPVSVDVRWPDGTVTTQTGVVTDADLTLSQP